MDRMLEFVEALPTAGYRITPQVGHEGSTLVVVANGLRLLRRAGI